MQKCERCAESVSRAFRCPNCGGIYCSQHKSHADHECSDLVEQSFTSPKETRPSPEPIDPSAVKQSYSSVSATPADPSPDVNPDGSLAEPSANEATAAGIVPDLSIPQFFHRDSGLLLSLRIWWAKFAGLFRNLIRLCGLLLVLLGAYNLLIAPMSEYAVWAPYRLLETVVGGGEGRAIFYLDDVLVMVIGALVTWWS